MAEAFITPEFLLAAYAKGYFPMGDSATDEELGWYYPEQRGVIPLDGFHIPKKLKRLYAAKPFAITTDEAFAEVMRGCAERESTWINRPIHELYNALHEMGHAHSVECWQENVLVGGLYGVSLGAAFFGESMFSRVPNASKIALVYLVERLKSAGYTLLDSQYVNDHLKQFGIVEIPRKEYLKRLEHALAVRPVPQF